MYVYPGQAAHNTRELKYNRNKQILTAANDNKKHENDDDDDDDDSRKS